jgi:2-octaprenylphenol hydroxylase
MGTMETDVLIAGAGLAGCTLAGLLSRAGLTCVLVDPRPFPGSRPDDRADPRALAITPASENILKAIDVWRHIPAERIGSFTRMQVWDSNGSGEVTFDSADICMPALGHIIEQPILQRALDGVIDYLPGVTVLGETAIAAFTAGDERVTAELAGGRLVEARLLVAADGTRSRTRELAGIHYPLHDYHQHAVACIADTALPHNNVARQRFLSDGPLAFLPMADPHRCGIVWSTSEARAGELMELPETEFNRALGDAFDLILGEIRKSESRRVFPLYRAQAEHYCQTRLVLIGDAAHCVHPLAGQGANLGLLDAAGLAEVIAEAGNRDRDIGGWPVLRRYERWRKGENRLMMTVLEGFKYLFENRTTPVTVLRNTGMNLFNALPFIKEITMRRAMGLEGDLPRAARPAAKVILD